jgi:hypothetical protein
MAKVRDISEYCLLEDVDLEKARKLHALVGELRERLIEDRVVQDVLLNRGCELEEDERSKSFYDVISTVFNRTKTIAHLVHLDNIIDLATRPRLLVAKMPLLVIPGQDQVGRIETGEGIDASRVEWLQEQWFDNPEVARLAREYQTTLNEAFDEYNMQFILNLMRQSLMAFIDPEWKKEAGLQRRIEKTFTPEAHNVLDSAYYNMGNRFFSSVGPIWEELNGSEYGKLFILMQEDVQEFLKHARKIRA